jgi:predicted  nucleic acid-binding Zn-ribbon protein
MKIGENTEVKVDLKTIVSIIVLTASFVGMYYTLQSDIEVAKNEPAAQIERLEYDLKEEWNADHIQILENKVDGLIEVVKSLDEELQTILINKSAKSDDKFEELNNRLEELQNQKPTVIIKEVTTKKKKLF